MHLSSHVIISGEIKLPPSSANHRCVRVSAVSTSNCAVGFRFFALRSALSALGSTTVLRSTFLIELTIANWNSHMPSLNASALSIIVGRFLLGLYFLAPGISKLFDNNSQLMLMEARGIPFAYPLLVFAGVSSLLGAVALMSGRYVKLAAYGFVVYVLLVNVLIHPYWIVEAERQNFFKNLAIMSGLLVLAGHAQFRWLSPSNWWKSDTAALKS